MCLTGQISEQRIIPIRKVSTKADSALPAYRKKNDIKHLNIFVET